MEAQVVDLNYLTRLAFEQLMQYFVRQTGGAYKGQGDAELVLRANPTDDMPFILLKRVGVWMNWHGYVQGNPDEFRGVVRTEVDGVRVQIIVTADKTTLTLKRLAPVGG